MKRSMFYLPVLIGAIGLVGCQSLPPGAEPGPHHTMAYEVLIEASAPGARIQANGQDIGNTPVRLKIFGDPDGTFHDFGSDWYVIKALPLATNQFEQVRFFGTGRGFGHEDRIPQQVDFDMSQRQVAPPTGPPGYGYPYPYYGPPPYPYYYGPSYYYRPGIWIGPGHYHHRW